MRIGIFTSILLTLVMLTSCSGLIKKMSYSPADAAKVSFAGAHDVSLKSAGIYTLNWDYPSGHGPGTGVTFNVFTVEVTNSLGYPAAVVQAINQKVDSRVSYSTVSMADNLLPSKRGRLLTKVVDQNFLDLDAYPKNAGVYAFQVQYVDSTGKSGGNSQVLLFKLEATVDPAVKGCVSATLASGATPTTAQIKFDFPDEATKMMILRDGVLVFSTTSRAISAWIDPDVKQGITYQYSCVATISGIEVTGSEVVSITVPDPIANLGNFQGCVSGTALDSKRIKVIFEYPVGIEAVNIYRNGIQVFSQTGAIGTTFTDSGLDEGTPYQYVCEATAGASSKRGSNILTVATLAANPPVFAGIQTAINPSGSSSSIRIGWNVGSGTAVNRYDVYCNTGTAIDWTQAARLRVTTEGALTATVTGLGDELTYYCGVRACNTASGNDICDTNAASLSVTLPDGGAPGTIGAASVAINNGRADISVPWTESQGAVKKRRIFQCLGAACGTNIANFTNVTTTTVLNLWSVPTTVSVSSLAENTAYNWMVIDEDPLAQAISARNVVSYTTGDLTAPAFAGLSGIAIGTTGAEDTTMTLSWTAIAKESVSPATGASHYLIYQMTGTGNACTLGTQVKELSTSTYTPANPYTYVVDNLAARTTYSFCMKARDTAGNISSTTQVYTRSTLDITAPSFDGLQTISFNSGTGQMMLTWNESPSSDRYSYRVKLWKDSDVTVKTFTYSDASNPTGVSFTKTSLGTFVFADNDVVHALVDACDDAQIVSGGTQNCTAFAVGTAKSYTIPDITPPPGFLGIESPANINFTTPAQGQIQVAWQAPGSWLDYRGFRVYSVATDNTLTQMKDCACSGPDCPDHITTCLLTGLDAKRTYKLHVRAYDVAGNVTPLDPTVSFANKTTTDTTLPTFSANFGVAMASHAAQASWSAATDNQYASEPGAAITYKVYRKTGSDFANLNNPGADDDALSPFTTTSLTISDAAINESFTYYYTVCAQDTSANVKCAGASSSLVVPDITPPIITGLTTNKTTTAKTWNLTWSMSDNISAVGTLSVAVHRSYSASVGLATLSDEMIYNGTGATTLSSLVGRQNADEYVNYLVAVTDGNGNRSTSTISVYSTNHMTITSLTRAKGTTVGGKFVFIKGSGFESTATITIGGAACTNAVTWYWSTMMGCTTPASAAGPATILITNSDGSTVSTTYTYYTYTGIGSDDVCDNPTQPVGTFYSGTGVSVGDPYLICTPTQFMLGGTSGKYYKFMDNLDVSGWANGTFGRKTYTLTTVDGNNFVVANWTFDNSGLDNVELFAGSWITLRNLGMVNANLRGGTSVSGMATLPSAGSNLFFQGMVRATASYPAGIFDTVTGGAYSDLTNYGAISGAGYAGGIGGTWGSSNGPLTCVRCKNYGTVSGTIGAGGMVGYAKPNGSGVNNWFSFTDAANYGDVTCTGNLCGGLFGRIEPANITTGTPGSRGFRLTNSFNTARIQGSETLGGLIGYLFATEYVIDGCYNTGAIVLSSGNGGSGGLVGTMQDGPYQAVIRNSYSTGSVTAVAGQQWLGGLIGYAGLSSTNGLITLDNVYATGTVKAASGTISLVGGLVGYVTGAMTISNSHATGALPNAGNYAGGLVGYWGTYFTGAASTHSIVNSYSTSAVTSIGTDVGGLVGGYAANGLPVSISGSYASGSLIGTTYVGGLVGDVGPAILSIADSHASSVVNGTSYVGGLLGKSLASTVVDRSFSTGAVAGSTNVGGLIGGGPAGTVTNSFWDTQTSTQATSTGGTGKTTAEMKTSATFTAAGFDFLTTPIWKISATEYPRLNWQP